MNLAEAKNFFDGLDTELSNVLSDAEIEDLRSYGQAIGSLGFLGMVSTAYEKIAREILEPVPRWTAPHLFGKRRARGIFVLAARAFLREAQSVLEFRSTHDLPEANHDTDYRAEALELVLLNHRAVVSALWPFGGVNPFDDFFP